MFRKTIYIGKKMLDARCRMSDGGFIKSLFENSKKSPTATNIKAYGETIGRQIESFSRSLKVSHIFA